MCGRFSASTPVPKLSEVFGVEELRGEDPGAHYNVAPTMPVLAAATSRAGVRMLGTFRWGLIPSWAKDLSGGAKMINARADTVETKPAFRTALVRRRCIIPADGFYEWRRGDPVGGGAKIPFFISHLDGSPLAFAGLWEVWRNAALDADDPAALVRSCTIITTEANVLLAPVHDRMPVILPSDAWGLWLDPAVQDPAALRPLLRPSPPEQLALYAVSPEVNNYRNDGPHLKDPIAEM